ncbi:MAG: alpha/beta hydrolase [Burkholderiaceae bacterium]
MLSSVERTAIDGAAGPIEITIDWPRLADEDRADGIVFIGHPHPLFGGAADNKVVTTIARTFVALGWIAVRPNFRGVGASAGEHDAGNGETDDFLHLIATVPAMPSVRSKLDAAAPIAVAGFSFGSFVAARAANAIAEQGSPVRYIVLVGAAAKKWPMPSVAAQTLVIHGELDETIPLPDVLDWARPQELPVIVVPAADHFFHRRLGILKRLITAHTQGMAAIDSAAQTD